MTTALVNGQERVLTAWTLRVPAYGEWRAHVELESGATAASAYDVITLRDSKGVEWVGTARAVTSLGANEHIEVIGGASQLDFLTQERFYAAGIDARDVLTDLCRDAGETAAAGSVQLLPQWRTRGNSLREELDTLARWTSQYWRVLPSGEISLAVPSATGTPGILLEAARDYRVYESADLPHLTGAGLDGWILGTAIYQAGPGLPSVTVWEANPARRRGRPATVGAVVEHYADGRVDCRTDTGVVLGGIPVWSVAGYTPSIAVGARVLLADLGDDPRATVAYAAPNDAGVSSGPVPGAPAITLAGGESETIPALLATGRVIRYGDTLVFPVGVAATPTAMPCLAAIIPATPAPVSRVKA